MGMKLRHKSITGNVTVAGVTYDCATGVVDVEDEEHARLLKDVLGFEDAPEIASVQEVPVTAQDEEQDQKRRARKAG